jgi:PPOX class probable F420-dependent enzyme
VEEARGDAGLTTRRLEAQNSFYDRIRSRSAATAVEAEPATTGSFESLRGHKYALLVTFKRSGEGVPTPIWFGIDDEGKLYVRTGRDVAKVRRIRNNPRVRVAPCTVRGNPLGPPVEGTAHVLPSEDEERAEAALKSSYGLGRRLYESVGDAVGGVEAVYLEVTPVGAGVPAGETTA